jgi:sugar (pentulose or hexulose) kinase
MIAIRKGNIMTNTLTVHVTMNQITATWQDAHVAMELPLQVTAETLVKTLTDTMVSVLAGDTPDNIDINNAIEGLVALNENSESVAPILIADKNDQHFIEALTMNGIGGQLARKNAHDLTTTMPVVQILRLKNNAAEVYATATMYRPLTAYLRTVLTGHNVLTEQEASMTGMFDQASHQWDTQALALTGLTAIQLPEVGDVVDYAVIAQALTAEMAAVPSVKVH